MDCIIFNKINQNKNADYHSGSLHPIAPVQSA